MALALAGPQDASQISLSKASFHFPNPNQEQSLALETLNGFRIIHGLERASMDPRLNASATQYAELMAKSGHMLDRPDRVEAYDALNRALSYGYDQGVAELTASGLPNAPYAVVSFVDAPYHRRLLLKPGHFDFGCASTRGFTCLVLGGQATSQIVYSPPDGAHGIPTSWDGCEQPSPMRGSGVTPPYGYPVLIAAYGYVDKLVLGSASLTDQSGNKVDCIVRQPANDPESHNSVILVPKKPLLGNSEYWVSAKFSIGTESRDETWSFRTGNAVELPPKRKSKKG